MKSYVEGFTAAGLDPTGVRLVPAELSSDYPALAAALAGIPKAEGQGLAVPPVKIMLYAESGRIEACLLTYKGGRKAFVSLPAGTGWEQSLNDLFESGAILWKR